MCACVPFHDLHRLGQISLTPFATSPHLTLRRWIQMEDKWLLLLDLKSDAEVCLFMENMWNMPFLPLHCARPGGHFLMRVPDHHGTAESKVLLIPLNHRSISAGCETSSIKWYARKTILALTSVIAWTHPITPGIAFANLGTEKWEQGHLYY